MKNIKKVQQGARNSLITNRSRKTHFYCGG